MNIKKSNESDINNLEFIDLIILSVLFAIVSTVLIYSYGQGNQINELPIVMRTIDNTYLENDFYTNVSSTFGPRTYFAQAISLISDIESLPIVYFSITLLINVSISIISSLFARTLFYKSNLAGAYGSLFVMSITPFFLGYASRIFAGQLISSRLVIPFALLAIWGGIRSDLVMCTVFSIIGSVIHPTFGLEVGVISLLLATIGKLIIYYRNRDKAENTIRILLPIASSWLFFIIFALLIMVPFLRSERIPDGLYIYILSYFRHPHHDIPSTFPVIDYIKAIGFIIASGISWYWWKENQNSFSIELINVAILFGMIVLICIGGFIFVEVIPTRFGAIARTFRLLLLVKWLGLILSAGAVAELSKTDSDLSVDSKGQFLVRAFNSIVTKGQFLAISLLSPITMVFGYIALSVRKLGKKYFPKIFHYFRFSILLIISLLLLVVLKPQMISVYSFLIFSLIIFIFRYIKINIWFSRIITFIIVIAVISLSYADVFPDRPNFTLKDINSNKTEIAYWAESNTPHDSVFLTPPDFGIFRLAANRSIVVDFKAFPFQDQAMLEWYERLEDCYDVQSHIGFDAVDGMDRNYRNISSMKLMELRNIYDINYAVIYHETETTFPIIYETKDYKVVVID